MYEYFGDDIGVMERKFLQGLPQTYHDFFMRNEETLKKKDEDLYYAMDSLAKHINLKTYETLLINSIVDFSSFCTSIIQQDPNTKLITHARNLDFNYPEIMQKLVYNQVFYKDGVEIATAPSIAGYYGAYTGIKPDHFTISYNVRFSQGRNKRDETDKNIGLELD